MNAKHTPGPWIIDCAGDMDGYSTVRVADGSENGRIETQPIATIYADADAHLIAAAPELLAALAELTGRVEGLLASDPDTAEVWRKVGYEHRRAQAALAKARGEVQS